MHGIWSRDAVRRRAAGCHSPKRNEGQDRGGAGKRDSGDASLLQGDSWNFSSVYGGTEKAFRHWTGESRADPCDWRIIQTPGGCQS